MAETKDLLAILKGLPPEVAEKIVASAQESAQKALDRAEAQKKLDEQKAQIASAIKRAVGEIKTDVDIKVRNGEVEIHLVGMGGRGGSGAKATPIKDSGMSMRQLVENYTPDKLAEFDTADTKTGSGRGLQYKLATAALKMKNAGK